MPGGVAIGRTIVHCIVQSIVYLSFDVSFTAFQEVLLASSGPSQICNTLEW